MFSRTFQRRYASPASAEATWDHLADPVAAAASSSHPTVAVLEGPLQVGATWMEHHIDEGCDFESVLWTCTALEPGRLVTVEGLQSGALQRATSILHVDGDRVEVEAVLQVRLALRSRASVVERAMMPILLLTPFGRRMIEEQFDTSVQDTVRALGALTS